VDCIFVVQHGGIFGEVNQVDGEGWKFRDRDAAEGVGDGYIGVGEGEFNFLGEDGDYSYILTRMDRNKKICIVLPVENRAGDYIVECIGRLWLWL